MEDCNRHGNDDRNVMVIARRVAHLDNKAAWQKIEEILREAGYKRSYLTIMREKVWQRRGTT